MNYITSLEKAKTRIIELYPKFANSNFVEDNTGWCNFVVKVDGENIFRFPRNEESYRILKNEKEILDYLLEKLPEYIKVPEFIYQDFGEDGPFVGYKMIKGDFVTQEFYEEMSENDKNLFAKAMTEFLNIMHKIDTQKFKLDFVEPISNYQKRFAEFKQICFKYLNEEEKDATIALFENYFADDTMTNYVPTVIHGDLSSNHILKTENGIGIIDFGDVRIFDPAYDFIWAYLWDEKLFDKILESYNGNYDENFKHRIKDFYIKRTAYYGIVYGDETNNKKLIDDEIKNLRKYLLK